MASGRRVSGVSGGGVPMPMTVMRRGPRTRHGPDLLWMQSVPHARFVSVNHDRRLRCLRALLTAY